MVTMPRVSRNLLIGDYLRVLSDIVPASWRVRSLPASVLSFLERSSRKVYVLRASSVKVLYACSASGTNWLIGFCMLVYQLGTLAERPQTSLNTCCAANVTFGNPVVDLPTGYSLESAGTIL